MASELSLKTPSTGLVTLSPADTATDKTITLPATTGTMVVQDGTNTTTINNLAYTGTLTGGTGVINIGSGQVYKDASGNVGIGTVTHALTGASRTALTINAPTGQLGIFEFGVNNALQGYIYANASQLTINRQGANPITFETNATERMRLDSSGNLGLGVTPSAWGSLYKALQINTTSALWASSDAVVFSINNYNDGSFNRYITTGAASRYFQNSGAHAWEIAPSGTAGNAISFTQAMTLTAAGNLGVGTASPVAKFSINNLVGSPLNYIDGTAKQFTSNTGIRVTESNTANATIGGGIDLANNVYSVGAYSPVLGFSSLSPSGSFNNTYAGIYGVATGQGTDTNWVNGALVFATTTSGAGLGERMRINAEGNFLIGSTSQIVGGANHRMTLTYPGGGQLYGLGIRALADNTVAVSFGNAANTQIGSITVTASTTAYNTSSDYRLKENVAPMTGALATVTALKPCTYNWKADGSAGQGFIAHELQAVVPDCVTGTKDAVDKDGKPRYQGVDTSFLVATLVSAIQELTARLEVLENK